MHRFTELNKCTNNVNDNSVDKIFAKTDNYVHMNRSSLSLSHTRTDTNTHTHTHTPYK